MRKFMLILAAACLVLAGTGGAALAKKTIKFGHVAPPFHGQSKGVDAFAAYVKEKTGGEIEIKTFPFGQLGSERSMAEQVQAGTLEMATITTAVMSNYVPQMAVVDLPFVFPSRKVAYATLDDMDLQKKLFSYLPAKGFVGVGFTENEFRDINSKKGLVLKPADLKGIKIRVMNSPVFMDTFRQLGASPVGIPFPELYNALQQGVIDAQENPLLTSILIKATEVAKYVTDTNHILTECVIIVNPDFWAGLSAKQKAVFQQAAKVAITTNRKANEQLHQKLPKTGISVAEYCKKNGVTVAELTPAQRQAFVKAVQPVWAKYKKIVGPELYDFFMNTVKKHNK
ncbi:MAG: TRAP transporter substrate-binding protein DctP [Desulfarculaceae bacterium]|nr:TRAP transporter substrate-binding protein DctP [Desulfarculaceae bacterium]MCF8074215.1 TRAP transporter substrate-binding protein DctP [Desulfarculaceae bacterium]MCF8103833.1 TRAP transporter substrate-binding protein DctP [Desulfarculaceae bacterium]MCF8116349.1 TRAP transporter substrate-binding protein DctP [Desulfarculaceae bacterium]